MLQRATRRQLITIPQEKVPPPQQARDYSGAQSARSIWQERDNLWIHLSTACLSLPRFPVSGDGLGFCSCYDGGHLHYNMADAPPSGAQIWQLFINSDSDQSASKKPVGHPAILLAQNRHWVPGKKGAEAQHSKSYVVADVSTPGCKFADEASFLSLSLDACPSLWIPGSHYLCFQMVQVCNSIYV